MILSGRVRGAYPPMPCRASPPQGGRSTRGQVSPISIFANEVVFTLLRSLLKMPQKPNSFIPHGATGRGWFGRRAIARPRFGWGWCGSDALRSRVFHHAVFRKGPCTACCEMVLSTNVASVPTTGPSLGFRHVWQPPGRTAFTLTARRGAGKSGDEFFRRQSSLRVTWRWSAARSWRSAASSASTFTSIFSCSERTSSSAFRFTS